MTERDRRLHEWAAIASTAIILAWIAVGWWIGPSLVRSAYEQRSLTLLNDMFGGRDVHPVERYLDLWRRSAALVLGALAGGAILLQILIPVRDRIGRAFNRVVRAEPTIAPLRALGFAVATGLLVGFLEFLQAAIKYRVDGVFSDWSNPDTIWMAPLAVATLFAAATAALLLLAGSWRKPASFRPLAAILIGTGIFDLLRAIRVGIHPAGAAVLGLGAGVALSGLAARSAHLRRRSVRYAVVGLTLAVGTGLAMHGSRAALERMSIAGLPEDVESPDIILLILDTVRAEQLGLYGYARPTTPGLDSIARSAIVFQHAFATSPWTLPSHASLFTGMAPGRLSAGWQSTLDDTYDTLAEELARLGYANAGFVANLHYTTRRSGLARGFHHYDDYDVSASSMIASSWLTATVADRLLGMGGNAARIVRKHAPQINREFLEWYDRNAGNRPVFAFLNYFDAHDPYIAHDEFAQQLGEPAVDSVRNAEGTLVARASGARANADRYDSMIAFLDHNIAALLDELRSRQRLDDTWIIITSDHGEQFGEHGLTYHGNSLYSQVLHVPLLIRPPGGSAQRSDVAAAVSITDLFPTILELAGGDTSPTDAGTSLVPLLQGARRRADNAPIVAEVDPNLEDRGLAPPLSLGPMKSIVRGRYHYIRNGDGSEELYDFLADPSEYQDLAPTAADSTIDRLRAALDSIAVPGGGLPQSPASRSRTALAGPT